MNLSIGKKIGLGFTVALLALLTICAVMNINLRELSEASGWVTHTVEVQKRIESLRAGVIQVESTARGYQLIPDATARTAFQTALNGANEDFKAIQTLTRDNPVQQENLHKLDPLLQLRFQALQKLMDLRDSGVAAADPQRLALLQEGRQTMADIHEILTGMLTEEDNLLKARQDRAERATQNTSNTIVGGMFAAVALVLLVGFFVTYSITAPLRILRESATRIGGGDYAHRVRIASKDEVGELSLVFNRMASQIEERQLAQAEQDWLKGSLARFALLFQAQRDMETVCQTILSELATLLEVRHSVLYLVGQEDGQTVLLLQASYAAGQPPEILQTGEGLVGQCLVQKERLILREVPDDYLRINSVLGEAKPKNIVVQPTLFYGEVKAVLELASFREFTPVQIILLDQLSGNIGTVLNTLEGVRTTELLLEQAQVLSENLQARQNELSDKNSELESQAERLRQSEVQLQEQQEELKQTNEELEQTNEELQQTNEEMEEKVNLLAEQKRDTELANLEIEKAREALEQQARQVTLASKYKSDFLANMSHELRTPLNSLLILSKILSDNGESNLTARQVQYAETIYSSGNDLLELINEVLDLSKIESGAVELAPDDVAPADIVQTVEQTFRHLAEQKKLEFKVDLDARVPGTIRTDLRRLQQILKNLLSNAFKFTETGSIRLQIRPATAAEAGSAAQLEDGGIAFAVTDTGIGIPPDKQQLIFEAFQQADAGTARKYGGTGLGLSISREIAVLLGGGIKVESRHGEGSTFTLYLPRVVPAGVTQQKPDSPRRALSSSSATRAAGDSQEDTAPLVDEGAKDDRAALEPGDNVLLIIEDDTTFANIMMDFARDKKFKVLLARSAAQGLLLAQRLNPSAITLDLHLPDNDGWMVLDHLKHDPKTRHIPIHIISVDEERERSLRLGAVSYFQKPMTKEILDAALNRTIEFINRPLKNLLIIEDDAVQRQSMVDLIGNGDVHSTAVGSAADAFAAMETTRFDCVVLDLGLPDQNGIELIREIQRKYGPHAPPIIVYTGKDLTRQEETELRMISESIVIKNVRSPERLLDETALFLHRVQTKLPEPKRRMIEEVQKKESILSGRHVLVVDDDVRNIFAITSALETSQMQVIYAESGQAAIDQLGAHPETEVVLMDVMMPGMDGFEAIRRIRRIDQFKKLPIISVTAKAMKGDREKCLEAGASDYITKPVDMDQLRSLLRVWLYK